MNKHDYNYCHYTYCKIRHVFLKISLFFDLKTLINLKKKLFIPKKKTKNTTFSLLGSPPSKSEAIRLTDIFINLHDTKTPIQSINQSIN